MKNPKPRSGYALLDQFELLAKAMPLKVLHMADTILDECMQSKLDEINPALAKPTRKPRSSAAPVPADPAQSQPAGDAGAAPDGKIPDAVDTLLLSSWADTTREFWSVAIAEGKTEEDFKKCLGLIVTAMGKVGKEESIGIRIRRKLWRSFRDGLVNFETGKISETGTVLA